MVWHSSESSIQNREISLLAILEIIFAISLYWGIAFYYDFYLQPQIVIYAKLASMHGFDLGINHEIAPKELIQYEPLPQEEYQDIVDFMKPYKLSYPYSYLQNWIDYYVRKTDQLFPS